MEKMELGRSGEREGRRRRIMERGTDRMALITGRVQALRDCSSPSSLPSSPCSLMEAHHSHTQSSPALFLQHHPIAPPNFHVGSDHGEQDPSGTLVNNDFGYGFSRAKSFDLGSRVESRLHKCETKTQAVRGDPAMEVEYKLQPSPSMTRVPNSSNGIEAFLKHYGIDLNSFTPKEINSSIIASENTRVLCSIVIGLLVVLSNISLPRTIVKSKSIIASKPLYVLLMTDVAIVIARLALGKRGVPEKNQEEKETSCQEDGPNWDGAVKVLELGLVVHQTLRAIFIDCSFYMVIVICGLCLL